MADRTPHMERTTDETDDVVDLALDGTGDAESLRESVDRQRGVADFARLESLEAPSPSSTDATRRSR